MKLKYEDLLGKNFKYNGRGPDEYDCYGLVKELYRRLGINLPEYASTEDRSLIDLMINKNQQLFDRIERPTPFCIATFIIRPPYTSHMGVVTENCRQFIHIYDKASVVVSNLDHPIWSRRISGFYCYKRGN